jgi:predicted nucleotidyltransferase
MKLHGVEIPRDKIAEFCRRHGIRKLALFGSVLREDFGVDSDIDVLIEFQPDVRVGLRFFAMERELSALLGRKADLNTPGFLSKYFRDKILAEAEVQYESA